MFGAAQNALDSLPLAMKSMKEMDMKAMKAMKTMKATKATKTMKVMKAKSAKAKSKKLGKAESLTGDAWRAWANHVWATGPTWVWVVVCFTHLFCCRVTEVLKLKLVHINLQDKWLTVPALKGHGEIRKPITPSAEHFLSASESQVGKSGRVHLSR